MGLHEKWVGLHYFLLPLHPDFMHMSVVSSFLRRSGGFFLRRTFGSDRLYKVVFSLYVQVLLSSGDAPMEFFVEGTRSRTAKSLHPKLGRVTDFRFQHLFNHFNIFLFFLSPSSLPSFLSLPLLLSYLFLLFLLPQVFSPWWWSPT